MNVPNQNPEQIARDKIDELLINAGWHVQPKDKINLSANVGVAVKEYQTDAGPADYVLFAERKPVGIIEAKREDEGYRLLTVEEQSADYARSKLKHLNNDPLPFVYESTGTLTRFTDYRDPKPRGRNVFSFHRPETMLEWLKQEKTLRGRFYSIPKLDHDGLRPAQIKAIENLEESFKKNRPRALIQMATGAGKTFTASTFVYRLLKFANAKRILFVVDTKNLGEQAEQEFMKYLPKDDNRKFTELYNVQRLSSGYIASDSQVCISTIQRLYSILKGEELDDKSEEENPNEISWRPKEPLPVVYNSKVPIEQFDFIVIDECHRSIYNLWKQVLDYFDAFLIGLTATPDKRTFGFFNENVVSEYSYEESVTDGVNVPYDVYTIETEITEKGAKIKAKEYVDKREKLSRKKRWEQLDEDLDYSANELDRNVVNVSQIRNIIRAFKSALKQQIFPNRIDKNGEYEVPKTLIFAKTDSHADDIIKIVREEFDEGNDFCKKVTYKIDEDPKSVLNKFRNSYNPRIAVTVDMIATGTDVKPLECLLFMRDVKSINYFEQMKGRGTRTIDNEDLKMVSKTANSKTHFVVVDAIGAIKSKKTDSRPLERKRSVPLKDLLNAVTIGAQDEDLFLSLANRLIRLNKQITESEHKNILEYSNGKNLKDISKDLIEAYDPDKIENAANEIASKENTSAEEAYKKAHQNLLINAASVFNGKLNEYLDNVRKVHEQIIDTVNLDTVKTSEWNADSLDKAKEIIREFSEYLEKHKDEIKALSIFYNIPHKRKEITFKMIKEVLEKLKIEKPKLAPHYVWDAYGALENVNGSKPESELTALVSLIRKVCGIDKELTAYDKIIDRNFQKWVFQKQAGKLKFTEEQMSWLRMIKDHVTGSFHIEADDLDYTPFDAYGGKGKMWQLFGDDTDKLLDELNEGLVA
ncbi:MAG: DEAD/DEAH box helicase family protein [Spirochaetia bacterium]|nr:DEAD/DEAH box helicase family protein [Spirochaetia bacterium]